MEFEDFRQGVIESELEVKTEQHKSGSKDLEIEVVEVYESDDNLVEYGMRSFHDALDLNGAQSWSEVDSQDVRDYLHELSNDEEELNQDQIYLKNDINSSNRPGPEEYVEEWEEKGLLG